MGFPRRLIGFGRVLYIRRKRIRQGRESLITVYEERVGGLMDEATLPSLPSLGLHFE